VIDNVLWTDSWLSIAGAGCGLTCVGASEEQARKVIAVRPPGVEKTSRLCSRDSVPSGVKCGPHGGKNSEMKSVDGFLVEPQNQGRVGNSWELSHEW
jgi:hypothetical protein